MDHNQTPVQPDSLISEEELLTELGEDSSKVTFEPLGDAPPGQPSEGSKPPPAKPLAKAGVVPFTDEEIVDGSAFMTLMMAQRMLNQPIESQQQAEMYMQAYKSVFAPFVSTSAMIAPLKLGEALAKYGIGKNMQPGASLEALPPLVRITVGGVVLGVSSFMAMQAVKRVEGQQQSESDPTPRGSGSDSAGDQGGS